jgi:WD40 repeat protein
MHRRRAVFLLTVLVLTVCIPACRLSTRLPYTPTMRPTASPTTIAASPSPPPTPTVTLPPTPPSPISQVGPWGLLRTRHSVWVVSPDGSGLARLVEEDGAIFQAAASPSGGLVAFVAADKREMFSDLRLKYLTLPDGEARRLTHLLPPGTEIIQAYTGDSLYEATRSIRRTALAWSPDGRQLAFVGAQGEASADLYIYSLDTETITRLSDEAEQAYNPSWSPDGSHIFFPSVRHFGTGAGYTVGGRGNLDGPYRWVRRSPALPTEEYRRGVSGLD